MYFYPCKTAGCIHPTIPVNINGSLIKPPFEGSAWMSNYTP